jgi:hypothetical protein
VRLSSLPRCIYSEHVSRMGMDIVMVRSLEIPGYTQRCKSVEDFGLDFCQMGCREIFRQRSYKRDIGKFIYGGFVLVPSVAWALGSGKMANNSASWGD